MQLILLTHSREVSKKTNTGQLVQLLIPNTQTIIWQRTHPNKKLLQLIASEKIALVYPESELQSVVDNKPVQNIKEFEIFILIDSTWQEARKMFNRSPYLQNLPRIQLTPEHGSQYNLRRNQLKDGLCTAECVIELLRAKSYFKLRDELNCAFLKLIK